MTTTPTWPVRDPAITEAVRLPPRRSPMRVRPTPRTGKWHTMMYDQTRTQRDGGVSSARVLAAPPQVRAVLPHRRAGNRGDWGERVAPAALSAREAVRAESARTSKSAATPKGTGVATRMCACRCHHENGRGDRRGRRRRDPNRQGAGREHVRAARTAVSLVVGWFTLTCNRPEGRLRRVCAGAVGSCLVRVPRPEGRGHDPGSRYP